MFRKEREEGRGEEGKKQGERGRGKVESSRNVRALHLYKLTEVRGKQQASKQNTINASIHQPIKTSRPAQRNMRDAKTEMRRMALLCFLLCPFVCASPCVAHEV